jgi:hypothetical protein
MLRLSLFLTRFIQGASKAYQVGLIPIITFPSVTRRRVDRRHGSPASQFLQLNGTRQEEAEAGRGGAQ